MDALRRNQEPHLSVLGKSQLPLQLGGNLHRGLSEQDDLYGLASTDFSSLARSPKVMTPAPVPSRKWTVDKTPPHRRGLDKISGSEIYIPWASSLNPDSYSSWVKRSVKLGKNENDQDEEHWRIYEKEKVQYAEDGKGEGYFSISHSEDGSDEFGADSHFEPSATRDRYDEPPMRATARKSGFHEKRQSSSRGSEKRKKEKPKSGLDGPIKGMSMKMAFNLGKISKAAYRRSLEENGVSVKTRDKEERRARSEKQTDILYISTDSESDSDILPPPRRPPTRDSKVSPGARNVSSRNMVKARLPPSPRSLLYGLKDSENDTAHYAKRYVKYPSKKIIVDRHDGDDSHNTRRNQREGEAGRMSFKAFGDGLKSFSHPVESQKNNATKENSTVICHGLSTTTLVISHTISEDRTGDRDEVLRKLLAPQNRRLASQDAELGDSKTESQAQIDAIVRWEDTFPIDECFEESLSEEEIDLRKLRFGRGGYGGL